MPLNLSPADRAEYQRRLDQLNANLQACRSAGQNGAATYWRRKITDLHNEFKRLEPPPPPRDLEQTMTLEERIERIEQHLKLGRWAE